MNKQLIQNYDPRFHLSRYEALCKSLISSSYRSITVQEYIQGQAVEPFVILRHDVDRRPEMALEMTGMEKDMEIRATYYFRMHGVCLHSTLSIPDETRKEMKKHSEIKWSEIARKAIIKRIEDLKTLDLLLEKSTLKKENAEEIAQIIKN